MSRLPRHALARPARPSLLARTGTVVTTALIAGAVLAGPAAAATADEPTPAGGPGATANDTSTADTPTADTPTGGDATGATADAAFSWLAASIPTGIRHHHHHRSALRAARARAHAIHARALTPAGQRADFGRAVLAEASRHAGAPYVYGATGAGAFDCSGFTGYVYRQVGVSLPRTSFEQYAASERIPASAASPGDLIFVGGLGHVAIYAGPGLMWDAPSSGGTVGLHAIYSGYVVGRVRH